jgi:hypothetical protein
VRTHGATPRNASLAPFLFLKTSERAIEAQRGREGEAFAFRKWLEANARCNQSGLQSARAMRLGSSFRPSRLQNRASSCLTASVAFRHSLVSRISKNMVRSLFQPSNTGGSGVDRAHAYAWHLACAAACVVLICSAKERTARAVGGKWVLWDRIVRSDFPVVRCLRSQQT